MVVSRYISIEGGLYGGPNFVVLRPSPLDFRTGAGVVGACELSGEGGVSFLQMLLSNVVQSL